MNRPVESVLTALSAVPGSAAEPAVRPDPMIRFDGIAKTYETKEGSVRSLNPVSLDVAPGEFVSIVGPSGCGKSTLLKIAAGLLPASEGTLIVNGKAVDGPPDDIGMVFQNAVLLAWRDILSNIMLQIEVRKLDRATYLARAKALIEMAGLTDFAHKLPWQLSGGMQQRAAICRALVHDPKILLMDEPFGALDAMTREKMNLELQRIWLSTGKTVLLITHSIPEAVFLSDRVVVMSERPGSIAAIYDVKLPRPRGLDVMGDPEFARLTRQIRSHFYAQGNLDE
ncbi:Bicarbonate transport ATP-binding protein CmpD [Pandoraea fibrosis]|uniref:Bicarbonate transport ATP-binding protein CmpD n=2 Tax=Pandoraea fibrosis TaxID=1891094 RepID=A0A5E4XKX3_9BURK|nr:Bicarbonate transport ATP-binding protein CmpD [Pandoraea fibrosis]